jgi:hypothetical protein
VGEDRTPPVRRTTVAEAAEVLGISAEAVRGRIRRGTLPVEREGGAVYVLVTETDQPRTTSDQPTDRTDLLIAELQDRVRSLEEANRENRRIIAALTQRIPEIEPPPEPPGRPSEATATEQPGRVGPQPPLEGAQVPSESPETPLERPEGEEAWVDATGSQEGAEPRVERSWWRRVFGG